ncbi:MAG TPA: hypothetical protein VGH14_02820 [Solirubrobacterales bacterium]|jgi:hypothetical protein
MIDWKRVPWSLWLFCVTGLAGWAVIEVGARGTIPEKALFTVLMFAWIYYLLRGVQWVWILTVAISVLALVPYAFATPFDWLGVAGSLFGLALLLLPVTRRFFADGTATADIGD